MTDAEILDTLDKAMKRQGWSRRAMEQVTGVYRNALTHWTREGRQPGLANLRAMLNAVGYDITIVPAHHLKRKPPPPSLPKRQRPLAMSLKLTQEQVDDIRTQRLKSVEFAQLYGVSEAMVSQILSGKRWPEPADR